MHTATQNTATQNTAPQVIALKTPTPREFGVGGRITLSVMSSNYVSIILGALASTDPLALTPESDVVSTWVTGDEALMGDYFVRLIAAAAAGGEHVSASIMFSRGCPGEISCELPVGHHALVSEPPTFTPSGVSAVAQWAIYPLNDGDADARANHMRDIYAVIELAKNSGSFSRSDHYVTRLEGDLAQIMETVVGGWMIVGRTVSHVTTHLTVSVNSPSSGSQNAAGASEVQA